MRMESDTNRKKREATKMMLKREAENRSLKPERAIERLTAR